MADTITREELRERIEREDDFVLLETLSRDEFDREHLPGARSLPTAEVGERASDVIPDRDAEIIVYCASFDCDASERAAAKLEELGYTNVIDYEGGKADWKQAELATV